MHAMLLEQSPGRLVPREVETPRPGAGELLLKVAACGVCRTDLHIVDGELTEPKLPLIPGHQIVGRVVECGKAVDDFAAGERVGVPWLGYTDGECRYCRSGRENLCEAARFTGYTIDGGYAEYAVADRRYCFRIPERYSDTGAAPLLCAGLIGYRCYRKAAERSGGVGTAASGGAGRGAGESIVGADTAGRERSHSGPAAISRSHSGAAGPSLPDTDARGLAPALARFGLYGFGGAAHILAQIAVGDGVEVYAFTRAGDEAGQAFARRLGAVWAGSSDEPPPAPLDAAIVFAPIGALVVNALRAVDRGGRVVCGGIHMSDIPSFPYRDLWEEREIVSVANLTREDGIGFMEAIAHTPVHTTVHEYPLESANDALDALRSGSFEGAAVLVP